MFTFFYLTEATLSYHLLEDKLFFLHSGSSNRRHFHFLFIFNTHTYSQFQHSITFKSHIETIFFPQDRHVLPSPFFQQKLLVALISRVLFVFNHVLLQNA